MKEITFHFNYYASIIKTPKGYTLKSIGKTKHVKDGIAIRLWCDTTDEQIMLSDLLAGKKFTEFDPVKIFGTAKPKGSEIIKWLKSRWGTEEIYPAMSWIKHTAPLDVLLEIIDPLPGVTTDIDTGWHWSSAMQCVTSPRYYNSNSEFKKHIRSL